MTSGWVDVVAQLEGTVVELFERYSHDFRSVHGAGKSSPLLRFPICKGQLCQPRLRADLLDQLLHPRFFFLRVLHRFGRHLRSSMFEVRLPLGEQRPLHV